MLFFIGLGGSIVLLMVSFAAGSVGFENTLADELLERSVMEQFLLVALFAPVLEEFLFRLALVGRLRLGMLAAVGAVGFVNFVFGDGAVLAVAALFGAVAIASGVLWIQSLIVGVAHADRDRDAAPANRAWRDGAARWWASHPRWPMWIALAAFGLVHLSNYDVNWSASAVVVVPLVVSPQLWLGLMFTIARVRYGWWAGLVLHAIHNLAVWGVSSLLSEFELS
ncbi:type II CAAX prenyl endopeptidase Rce1 family protein [Candidatus Poriferisodalis sp.]|uniref:CPBP family glutamic-type intramembrane protease n=1 Tax=Candidatus Poriferisodalis sp. TaxID=3101277 RepID=UPI003B028C33